MLIDEWKKMCKVDLEKIVFRRKNQILFSDGLLSTLFSLNIDIDGFSRTDKSQVTFSSSFSFALFWCYFNSFIDKTRFRKQKHFS